MNARSRKGHIHNKGAAPVDGVPLMAGDASRLDAIDQARALWQPLAGRPLSREDGREIIENMSGFFAILREWARAEQRVPSSRDDPDDSPLPQSPETPADARTIIPSEA